MARSASGFSLILDRIESQVFDELWKYEGWTSLILDRIESVQYPEGLKGKVPFVDLG